MDFDDPPPDPVPLFRRWLEEASRESGLPNPNAMSLATVDPDGRPSARIVLLKQFDERGAVFYTNFGSRKACALAANPRAALLFHWDRLDRQVRIEGAVTAVPDSEADEYFATRDRQSQLGAWASDQSRPIAGRGELIARFMQATARFAGMPVPRPPNWGGFRVLLQRIEFWQGRPHRLHDRIVYVAGGDGWTVERLAP